MKNKITFDGISPIYYQIKEDIKKRIKNMEFKTGSQIPTELELADFYDVNRMTLRRSLDELRQEGFIYKKRGLGTFVSEKYLMIRDHDYLIGLHEEMTAKGYPVKNKVLLKDFVKSPAISEKLGLPKDSDVFHLQRLRYLNKLPYAFDDTYTLPEIGERLINEDLENKSFYSLIEGYGHIPTNAVQEFKIIKTPPILLKLIKTPLNKYIFYSERMTLDQNNKVVSVSHLHNLDENYSIKIILKRRLR